MIGELTRKSVVLILILDDTGTNELSSVHIWVCLKMGYTPNYSHLVGIMIINHWV